MCTILDLVKSWLNPGVFVLTGDVLIQISETQRRLTAEMEGVVSTFLQYSILMLLKQNTGLQ